MSVKINWQSPSTFVMAMRFSTRNGASLSIPAAVRPGTEASWTRPLGALLPLRTLLSRRHPLGRRELRAVAARARCRRRHSDAHLLPAPLFVFSSSRHALLDAREPHPKGPRKGILGPFGVGRLCLTRIGYGCTLNFQVLAWLPAVFGSWSSPLPARSFVWVVIVAV